jgi:hypothetical protein
MAKGANLPPIRVTAQKSPAGAGLSDHRVTRLAPPTLTKKQFPDVHIPLPESQLILRQKL